jgi:hypothetical protein
MASRKQKSILDNIGPWLGGVIQNTPNRVVDNLKNVAFSNPLAASVQNAISGYSTFKDKGYVGSVKNQTKKAGIDIGVALASEGAGRVVGKAVSGVAPQIAKLLAKTNVTGELAPGQTLAYHFSPNPNLRTIKDIPALRNKGANFASRFDSTLVSKPGSTYAYPANVQGLKDAVVESEKSAARALAAGETRNYTLYVTQANPLRGTKGGVRDPEYAKNALINQQLIFGKQKVVTKVPINFRTADALENKAQVIKNELSQYGSQAPYLEAQQVADQARNQTLDTMLNTLAKNKKVTQAGFNPGPIQNPFSAFAYDTPAIPRTTQPMQSVTQQIRQASGSASKVGVIAGQQIKNKKNSGKKR